MSAPYTSPLPAIGFTIQLPSSVLEMAVDDTAISASAVTCPNNCREIVVYNMSTADRIFVKFRLSSDVTALTVNNSTVIPVGSSMTFAVGYLGDRQGIGDTSPADCNLWLLPESGLLVPVNITYLMGRGSSTP